MAGEENAAWSAAAIEMRLSSMHPHIRRMPADSAIAAMRRAGAMPPHFISLMLKMPQARGGAASLRASSSVRSDSSAAIRSRISSGSARIASTASAGSGCSTNSRSRAAVWRKKRRVSSTV